jgi:hypothetical protein
VCVCVRVYACVCVYHRLNSPRQKCQKEVCRGKENLDVMDKMNFSGMAQALIATCV